ncbi:MAG: toxin-antitoxin system YwqK family antitoxin [Myxococcaceae bacterium]
MNTKLMCFTAVLTGTVAFAAEPITLKCPEGSAQKLAVGQDLACFKGDEVVPGPVVMLYKSGKKMADGQQDAKGRTGMWTLYSETGVKTHTIEFSKGDFHGAWTELHSNGLPKTVIRYDRGMRVGEPAQFDTAGKPVVVTAKSTVAK